MVSRRQIAGHRGCLYRPSTLPFSRSVCRGELLETGAHRVWPATSGLSPAVCLRTRLGNIRVLRKQPAVGRSGGRSEGVGCDPL